MSNMSHFHKLRKNTLNDIVEKCFRAIGKIGKESLRHLNNPPSA